MPQDQKNFLLALAMSLLVIMVWEFWISPQPAPSPSLPPVEQQAQMNAPIPKNQPAASAAAAAAAATQSQPPSLWGGSSSSSRARIETPHLSGSISLPGAVFDDLSLTAYRENLSENAKPVQLLKPQTYQVSFGWSDASGEIAGHNAQWRIEGGAKRLTPDHPMIFVYQDEKTGLTFRRKVSVDENYMFTLTQSVINNGAAARQVFSWGAVNRKNHPPTSGFYLLHEGLIGFFPKTGLEEIDYDDVEDDQNIEFNDQNGWLGITDKYWAAVLIPDARHGFTARFAYQKMPAAKIYSAQFISAPILIPAGGEIQLTSRFFAGAKKTDLIDGYEENTPITRFDLLIDWGWFFFMTKPFFLLLDFFSKLSGNFGAAILIVTVLVKIVFFPLANKSYETMSAMRKMQPDIEKIRARNKGDMMAQNKEIAEVWKKHDVKPLMGCLPMLLQIPVFFALYKVLFVTIEMRHAPFFGWINDLSVADPTSLLTLFGLIPIPLPDFLIIGIWPLLMGLTMFVQMRLNPPPPDPLQRKIFAWAPVVIALLLARFPAGLVIYATWNTILSALQQGIIMKKQGVDIDLLGNLKIKRK